MPSCPEAPTGKPGRVAALTARLHRNFNGKDRPAAIILQEKQVFGEGQCMIKKKFLLGEGECVMRAAFWRDDIVRLQFSRSGGFGEPGLTGTDH